MSSSALVVSLHMAQRDRGSNDLDQSPKPSSAPTGHDDRHATVGIADSDPLRSAHSDGSNPLLSGGATD